MDFYQIYQELIEITFFLCQRSFDHKCCKLRNAHYSVKVYSTQIRTCEVREDHPTLSQFLLWVFMLSFVGENKDRSK